MMLTQSPHSPTTTKENRNLFCLLATSLFSLIFILSFSSSSSSSTTHSSSPPFSIPKHHQNLIFHNPTPPSIAYFISGSVNETNRILRLLFSIYHPRNQYLLHLDLTAPQSQRDDLALSIQSNPIFRAIQNVNVIGKADFAHPRGVSSISTTLRGAAILLRFSRTWDWFINLSASDYPLVTQDDLLHIMSYLPKDLNFVDHNSSIGWREYRRIKRITVDPGLYLSAKSDIFYATQKRELPNAYRLFTGSVSAILSRKFVEFCISGSDNFPRTILMYLSNMPSSQANYFPTVMCNARQFNKTVINHNLQYASWDESPKQEQQILGLNDLDKMIQSGTAFASGFLLDDPVLDHIDKEILKREPGRIVPGGWCLGDANGDPCAVWGDTDILRPGPGARRLERLLVELFSNGTFSSQQCIFQ